MRRAAIMLLGAVLIAGCEVTTPSTTTETTDAATPAPVTTPAASATPVDAVGPDVDVPWADYDASVKERIDTLGAAADCVGLQEEFNTADANNAATMDRTGHNNADLMGYIDAWMQDAGCY